MTKCNSLSVNVAAVNAQIQAYLIEAMEQAEDKLIELMREEIQKTTYGGAPGKPTWRDEISDMLKEEYRAITNQYMEFEVGVPRSVAENILVRAMIIYAGSGNKVGNLAIYAGPPGRSVWDGDVSGRKPSSAKAEYALPAEFNQTGNKFVDNAVTRMKTFFDDILDTAWLTLPSAVFYGNVIVS